MPGILADLGRIPGGEVGQVVEGGCRTLGRDQVGQCLPEAGLGSSLARQMRVAGPSAGAYVVDATTGRALFSWNPASARILASNTKLFTTTAALDHFGAEGTLRTEVLADGAMNRDGILKGDLWLRGGGDPAFGNRSYVRRRFGTSAATVEDLAAQLSDAGLTAVRGGVHGDESLFDLVRGVHDSRYSVSPWVGPLSALSFNHAYDSHGFQSNPASYAADRLRTALKAVYVTPGHPAAAAPAPAGAVVMATVESSPMATLVRVTNKGSDNFFAETLLKDLGRDLYGTGSSSAGAGWSGTRWAAASPRSSVTCAPIWCTRSS